MNRYYRLLRLLSTAAASGINQPDRNQFRKSEFMERKIHIVPLILFAFILTFGSVSQIFAANRYSVANGSWNVNTTWSASSGGPGGVSVPISTDNVFIEGGKTVTMTVDAACNNLSIASGSALTTGNFGLALYGNFIKNGTFTPGSSNITFAGIENQNIAGFTTTGDIIMNKTAGTALLLGNVAGAALTINGADPGTLNLGNNLTHTFTGNWTITASGKIDGGTSKLRIGGSSSSTVLGYFLRGTGTVEYYANGNQTILNYYYWNLTLSGSGIKTIGTSPETPLIFGVLSIEGTATISAAPNYDGGATLQYKTTDVRNAGPEWISPFSGTGGIIIANTAGSVTLDAPKVLNQGVNLTINNGSTLVTNNFALLLRGNFTNNGTFTAGTSLVTFNGNTAQVVGGTSISSFYNLTLNNSAGLSLGNSENVDHTLTLANGRLTLGDYNLTLDFLPVSGALGVSNMIVTTGTGECRRTYAANGSYLFPVGDVTDTPEYSPVMLNFTSGNYAAGYAGVRVVNAKHPSNASSTNYLNRYWTITSSGITAFSCDLTGTYVSADIAGTEVGQVAGKYCGSLPWVKYSALSSNTLTANGVTGFSDFTGITKAAPTVTISPNPSLTVCQNASLSLTATPVGDPTITYLWSPGGATTNSINPSTLSAGSYSYTVTVTDGNGFKATASASVVVNATPTVSVNSPVICASAGSSTITATPSPSGTYSYAWTVPSGVTNPGNIASFTVTSAGTYSVVVTDANSCTGSGSGTFTIHPNPSVTVNSPIICASAGSATITATPTPSAGPYKYAWTVPSGATDPGDLASFSATIAGNYSVVITDGNSCTGTGSGTMTIHANPVASITPDPATMHYGGTINMNGNPSGGSGTYSTHAWSGTGSAYLSSTNVVNPVFSGAPAGSYTLTYTVTDNKDCSGSDNINIIVYGPTIFVNDDSQVNDQYTTAIGNDNNPGTADAPLRTFLKAISVSVDGDVLKVDAGVYEENVVVNKRLQIFGAISGAFAPLTTVKTTNIGGNGITISVDGIAGGSGYSQEIQNIHCQGKSTDITVNNDYGINVTAAAYHLNLYNVYADNYRFAGLIFNGNYDALTAASINVWDCQFQVCDYGINLGMGMKGIHIKRGLIKNNRYCGIITAGDDGQKLTDIIIDGTPFVDNGTGGIGLSSFEADIFLQRFNGNGLFKDLTFTTYAATALDLRGKGVLHAPTAAAGTVQIQNCTFTGQALDANAFNKDLIKIRNYTDITNISFTGVTVNTRDNSTTTGLRFEDVGAGGDTPGPSGYVLSGITFPNAGSGFGHGYDIFNSSTLSINATSGVTFGGSPSNYTIEDRIMHKIDYPSLGLVTWIANNDYVTTNSYASPATTTPSIQRGIDAIATSGTVNIESGITYTGGADAATGGKNVTLSPGASPGCVTFAGDMTLNSGDVLAFDINGTTACTDYDKFTVSTGTVNLGGATLSVTLGYTPVSGDAITIIDGSSAIIGKFSQGSTIDVAGNIFSINYAGGLDGFDVVLTSCGSGTVHNTSLGTHYCKIQDAIDVAVAGNTITVDNGTFLEHVTINKAGLILTNSMGSSPVIDGGNTGTVVTITANNVTFDGFQVQNSGTTGIEAGIALFGVTGCDVKNNIITNNFIGSSLLGATSNTIELNTFTLNYFGVYVGNIPAVSTLNTITGNNISTSKKISLGSGRYSGDGIYADKDCNGNILTLNNLHNNGQNGCYFWKSGSNTVTGNIVSDNTSSGFELLGSASNTITGNTVTGNTEGFKIRDGGTYVAAPNSITGNKISGNTNYGIFAEPAVTSVGASPNWWGDYSGPTVASNPCGTGDAITTNVTYNPWYYNVAMTKLNGLPALTLSTVADISTLTKTPFIISETVTYPDLTNYEPAIRSDILISSTTPFPAGMKVFKIIYTEGANPPVTIPVSYTLTGSSVYLSDILNAPASSLVGHSNTVINSQIFIEGATLPATNAISIQSVAYIAKTGCISNLGLPATFTLTFANPVAISLTPDPAQIMCNAVGFNFNITYPAITNIDNGTGLIKNNAKITSNVALPASTLTWSYNGVPGAPYTVTAGTTQIFLSAVTGITAPLQGHGGLADQWAFTLT
ncbi:MAG: NosD domain-containing protein, partial [Bacteroidota bacterium]